MKVSGPKLGGTVLAIAWLIVAVGDINAEQSQPPRSAIGLNPSRWQDDGVRIVERFRTPLVFATDVRVAFTTDGADQEPSIGLDTPTGAAMVRGRVLAADGDVPLRNVRVTLTRLDRTSQTVLSDPEGRFVFSAVRNGTYTVAAVKPGFVTIRSSAPLSIATAAAVKGMDIRLPKGAAISGRLIDNHGDPVSGVAITAETVDALVPVAAGRTNDLGEYRLSGLPAGVYRVVANAGQALAALALNAARTFQQGDTLPAVTGRGETGGTRIYYPGVSSIRSAQRIEIVAGEERPNLDLRLEPNQLTAMSVRFGAAPAV